MRRVKKTDDNSHFLNYAKELLPGVDITTRLEEFGSSISQALAEKRRSHIDGLGEFLLKRRPSSLSVTPIGDLIERQAAEVTLFVPSQALIAKVQHSEANDHIDSDPFVDKPVMVPDGLSSFNLKDLPTGNDLWRICQSLHVLARINNDPQRYHAIQQIKPDLDYFSMDNSQGDSALVLFWRGHTVIKGFSHESSMSSWGGTTWPGIYDGLPNDLVESLFEEYLEAEAVSFCVWHDSVKGWGKGDIKVFPNVPDSDPDGSQLIFSYLPLNAAEYIQIYEEIHSRSFDPRLVEAIYEHAPLSDKMVRALNPDCRFSLHRICDCSGYPVEE
jgi:nucleoid DNA-binding protein